MKNVESYITFIAPNTFDGRDSDEVRRSSWLAIRDPHNITIVVEM